MPDAVPSAVPRLDLGTVGSANGQQLQARPTSPQSSTSYDHRCSLPTAASLATPRSAMPPQSPRQSAVGTPSAAGGNGSMAGLAEENTFTVTPYIAGLPDADQLMGIDAHRLCLDVRRAENLHGFELTELLSEGTFGKLHRATFEKSAEWIVREFPADVSHHDIARELRYFLRSVSPYVLPVKRILTEGLNVKYVLLHSGGTGGTTLTKWVSDHFAKATQEKAKKAPYRSFADIVACIFGALYDLHQDSVIHGNLHSDTIMVREIPSAENQFTVSLMDFNLACTGSAPTANHQQAHRPPPHSQHKQHGFVLDDYPEGTIPFQHEAGDSRRVCEATDNYSVAIIILKYLCRVTNFLSDFDSKFTEVAMPADHSEAKINALIDKLRDSLPKDEKSTLYQLLDVASRSIRVDATATALNHFVSLHKLATKSDKGPVRMYTGRVFATLKEFKESGRCWTKSQELIISQALASVGPTFQCTRDAALEVMSETLARIQTPSFVVRQPMIALMIRNTCEIMRASGMFDERICVLLAEANHVLGRPAMDPFSCVAQTFSPEQRARITVPIVADMLTGTLRVSVDIRAQAERIEELLQSCTTHGQDMRGVANLRFALADIYTHIGTRNATERSLFHATEALKFFKEIHDKDTSGVGKQDFQNAIQNCARAMERATHSRFIRTHDKSAAASEIGEAITLLKSILPADIEDSQDPFDAVTLYSLACLLQNVACRYRVDNEATCTKLLGDAFDYIQEGLQVLRRARIGPHFLLVVRFELQREMLHRLLSNQSKGREGIIGYRPDSQITPDCGDSQRHQTIRRLHNTLAERPPTNDEVLEILDEIYELEQAPAQRAKALVQKADFLMAIGQPSQAKRLYQTAMATFDRTQDDRTIIGTAVLTAREASGEKAPTPGTRSSGERSPRSGNRSPTQPHNNHAGVLQKPKPEAATAVSPPAAKPSTRVSQVTISTDPASPKAPHRSSPSMTAASQPSEKSSTTNDGDATSTTKDGHKKERSSSGRSKDKKKKQQQHTNTEDFVEVGEDGQPLLPNVVPELRAA